MRLRTITAGTVAEALEKVQEELGDDALVLETKSSADGAEVVAAEVEREEAADGLMRLRAEVALMRRELGILAPPAHPVPAGALQDRFTPVERRLVEQGLAPHLVERVLRMIERAPPEEGNPIDPAKSEYCRNALAGLLPSVGPPGAARARCFAFVGPAGAGKTTTVAKLAEQTREQGLKLSLVSLDGGRPGGTEVLARTAERLSLPFVATRGPEGLVRALDEIGACDRILVDTAGLGARESAALDALRERLHAGRIGIHLVLPANLETTALARSAAAFRPLRPSAVVFTKVDETALLGDLINLPASLDLPVAALAHGPSLRGDLRPASRPLIADLVLGRRRVPGGGDA